MGVKVEIIRRAEGIFAILSREQKCPFWKPKPPNVGRERKWFSLQVLPPFWGCLKGQSTREYMTARVHERMVLRTEVWEM